MKKTISVLLAAVLVFCVMIPCAQASQNTELYPTIIVAGYSSSALYLKGETVNEQIWGLDMDEVLSMVLSNIAQIGISLGALAFNNPDLLADIVGGAIIELCGDMACNPDGTSVKDIVTYDTSAEKTQFSYLYSNGLEIHAHEPEIMADIASEYSLLTGGEDGNRWIFSFQNDFRLNITENAESLDEYIEKVCEYTGKEKVNIFAVSHGGEISAVYLSEYGYKGRVNNAVLTVPAIGGAALAYDLMSENIVFDEETLLYFIENGMMHETDYDWLTRANQLGVLDGVCKRIMHLYAKKVIGYWGSIWDFIPGDYYEELKESLLDKTQSAPLIEKSDYYHDVILANMSDNLAKASDFGANIYIVAGTDSPSVTGLQETSDGIITVKSSTGAKCAPYPLRFSNGYITEKSVCSNETHNHLSPAMNIDASCAFLPDYTWFISGLFHGMTWKDDYTVALCKMLLFSENRTDVFTYSEFPQFRYSSNVCYSASAVFDKSEEGYVSSDDTSLIVTNLSKKYTIRLLGVSAKGIDAAFDTKKIIYIKPGECVTVPVSMSLEDISLKTADITISYKLIGSITPFGERTETFTVMNGKSPVYDENNPYDNLHYKTDFEKSLDKYTLSFLEKSGIFDLLIMIIHTFTAIFNTFRTFTVC